mgnify:FL=1
MIATIHYVDVDKGHTVRSGRYDAFNKLLNRDQLESIYNKQEDARTSIMIEEGDIANSPILICIEGGKK